MNIPNDTVLDRIMYRARVHEAKFGSSELDLNELEEELVDSMTRLELLEAISEAIEQRFDELQRLITLKGN